MKEAVNRSDVAKIRKMMDEDADIEEIAHTLDLSIECVKRNVKHITKTIKDEKNKKRALKAAQTRAQNKSEQEQQGQSEQELTDPE